MPSQVPPASTSRPESTLRLPFTWSADEPRSLEAEEEAGVDRASNEWKLAGSVGRARYSSRFAHRMLRSLRGQRDMERQEWGTSAVPGAQETVNAQCVFRVSEGPEADAHARSAGECGWETEGMEIGGWISHLMGTIVLSRFPIS